MAYVVILLLGAYLGGLITLIAIRVSDYKNLETAEVLDMLIGRFTPEDKEDFKKAGPVEKIKFCLFFISIYGTYPMLLMITVLCRTLDYFRSTNTSRNQ